MLIKENINNAVEFNRTESMFCLPFLGKLPVSSCEGVEASNTLMESTAWLNCIGLGYWSGHGKLETLVG